MKEICRGLGFPEGPIAMPDGSVILVEIQRGTLTRVLPNGEKQMVADCGGGPNGAALGPDGRIYVCNNGGFVWLEDGPFLRNGDFPPDDYKGGSIQVVDIESGQVETLYTHCNGEPLKGPNDIVFDALGGFYFTDLGRRRGRLIDRGAVYYATPDGNSIQEIVYPIDTPNGIGLSADEKTLYVAETLGARLWAWDIEAPGKLGAAPHPLFPGRLHYKFSGYERLDSMALDSEGNVVVATLGTGCVSAISPDGILRASIPVPEFDIMVTNICFGGPDLRTAYITSSGLGILYETEWHCPGLPLNFLNT
ncbi:MAG: SMP-30/gluconolactonase/LRE family protein [Chromatiales bacterium]|jgi:gluconolactonase|nr:SMP-30/gluconolactonase/LRE family protein [Chromatiales bacterium]